MSSVSALVGYSARQVAALLDLPVSRVRYFVRHGLLEPARGQNGEELFSFQHLVLLRTARGLLESGIPLQRVRRALERLAAQLPNGRALTAVRLTAEGGEVVVQAGARRWNPLTGQSLLDFEVAELAGAAAPLAPKLLARAGKASGLDADSWFEVGCELEPTSPQEAQAAYRQALELDPEHGDALLNLGRLYHEQGDPVAAEWYYHRVLRIQPESPLALFNLGVALEDQGRLAEALETYRAAIVADDSNADAYYNLAGVCERLGRRHEAVRYLKEYRALTISD
jgi:tetratricopeptide (TPR) repeat protein